MKIGNVDIKPKQLQNNLKRKVVRQQSQLAKSQVTKHREREGCVDEEDNALRIRTSLTLPTGPTLDIEQSQSYLHNDDHQRLVQIRRKYQQ